MGRGMRAATSDPALRRPTPWYSGAAFGAGPAVRRVMIVGGPGSGKSVLARALGARTGLPVYHIDRIHWLPGWVERDRAEKTRLCREIHARDRWIFEGGHSVTWPERLARSDTLVWLDVPVAVRQWRVITRAIRYWGESRPDLPEGCPEGFGWETLAFWRFIWATRATARARILAIFADPPPHLALHRLASRRDVRRFLDRAPGGGVSDEA
jgi:adenylate kinase family enzyme